jgi:hypothetical protein
MFSVLKLSSIRPIVIFRCRVPLGQGVCLAAQYLGPSEVITKVTGLVSYFSLFVEVRNIISPLLPDSHVKRHCVTRWQVVPDVSVLAVGPSPKLELETGHWIFPSHFCLIHRYLFLTLFKDTVSSIEQEELNFYCRRQTGKNMNLSWPIWMMWHASLETG